MKEPCHLPSRIYSLIQQLDAEYLLCARSCAQDVEKERKLARFPAFKQRHPCAACQSQVQLSKRRENAPDAERKVQVKSCKRESAVCIWNTLDNV